jgi:predicted RNase H-like HicB family nuclease
MIFSAKITVNEDKSYTTAIPDRPGISIKSDTIENSKIRAKEEIEAALVYELEGKSKLREPITIHDETKDLYPIEIDACISTIYRIRLLRGSKSAVIISKNMGISRQSYQRLELPTSNVSVRMLEKIAKANGKHLEIKFV